MARIIPIVEGHGEVAAVPILIRRTVRHLSPRQFVDVLHPIRVQRNKIVKSGVLEKYVQIAAQRLGENGGILVLLDADRDCPMSLGAALLDRASKARADWTIKVVLAKAEFEAWFLASANSIAGKRGIHPSCTPPRDPEAIRDAKRWLTNRMPRGSSYKPAADQAALTQCLDIGAARMAPSFDKFCRDVEALIRSQ